ncbi:MAG: roadblock/LC7 domain-containing protein [Cardiobacteriaceae bacterium]|nr:roadblock/LC7 domain-containing protein [Cardiobacteriaceae bacterium]
MATLESYRNEAFVAFCNQTLKDFLQDNHVVKSVILATVDGFEVSSAALDTQYSGDKLAAVSSTLFTLASSLVNEFSLNGCKSVTIDSDKGKVYLSSIKAGQKSLILMLQSNQSAILAHILHGAGKLSAIIGEKLDEMVK